MRLFGSAPLQRLKIYSFLPSGGFRLTNGQKTGPRESISIIGGNCYRMSGGVEGVEVLLRVLRPLPEIVVIGGGKVDDSVKGLEREFGCAVEISNLTTAATTFNTLIDDNRRVIGVFISGEDAC